MSVARPLTCLGLLALCNAGVAQEPSSASKPIAAGVPAYVAPEKPPEDGQEVPPVAEPEGALSLADALALALMGNPSLRAFSWEQRASEARELVAAAPLNPELSFRYYRFQEEASQDDDDSRRRVILSQVFQLGGKRRHRVELAQSESEVAGWSYETSRVDVATSVAARFAAVLGAQRRLESWNGALGFYEETRDRVAGLVASGRMRSLETHEVQRRIGLTRIEVQAAEGELRRSRLELAALWGSAEPRFRDAVGELEPLPAIPDLATALAAARRGPLAARWEAELSRGRAAVSAAKSERVPDVEYGVGVRWEEDFDRRDYLLDLGIDLPVFDSGSAGLREARDTLSRVQAERHAAEVERDRGIAEAHARLVAADATRQTLALEVLPATRAAFDAHRVGFERAAEDPGDLLDARRDLARMEAAHVDALVEYHEALGELEALVGESLPGTGMEP